MTIGVMGCGYVGISNAILLANNEEVMLWDIDANKLTDILAGRLPFDENELMLAIENVKNHLCRANDEKDLVTNNQLIIIAMPTDYNEETDELNTHDIEETVHYINENAIFEKKIVVIRSTVPIGFTNELQSKYRNIELCFMPEFLREGYCYQDTLFPERIVIGGSPETANIVHQVYSNATKNAGGNTAATFFMKADEAEAVKLFSNSYLSMRVAFFNELDSFSEKNNMSTRKIIEGVCADSRVGNIYNSPSFGYGGYCLPKDTRQLSKQVSLPLINAISESNDNRKAGVLNKLMKMGEPIGIYRIQSKKGATNTRNSVMYELLVELTRCNMEVYYYEPLLLSDFILKNAIRVNDVSQLAKCSNVIIANWIDSEIMPYLDKVYTRDLYDDCMQ